jgi:hypothetical protein
MANKFIDYEYTGDGLGLENILTRIKNLFATKAALKRVKDATDPFILSLDYSELEFDVNQIVGNEDPATSSLINTGKVNYMIIANS